MRFFGVKLFLPLLMLSCMAITSCVSVGKLFSTPSYSHHSIDKISLDGVGKNKSYSVYIKLSNDFDIGNDRMCKMDNNCFIKKNAMLQVENLFHNANITILDKPDNADYIIGVDIRNIIDDFDADFAKKVRNSFLQKSIISDYVFDKNNNNPYIYTLQKFDTAKDGQNSGIFLSSRRKSILPSVLYTFIGAGSGFIAGYFLGSVAPIPIGFAGALLMGGLTYAVYSSFKDVGIAVVYDISILKKVNYPIRHSRKAVIKISANISDEYFYTLNNNIENHISHNAIIAIGSRVLRKDMLLRISTMIANNVADTFDLR